MRIIGKNPPISSTTGRTLPFAGRLLAVVLVAWLVGLTAVFGAACSSSGVPSTTGAVSTTASSASSTTTSGDSSTTATSTSPVADAAVAFVELLVKGSFSEAAGRFDETMRQALPEQKLREVWTQVQQQAGAFQEIIGARAERQSGYDVALVAVRFGTTLLDVRVVYDGERRVAGLFFVPTTSPSAYEPPAYVDQAVFREQEVEIGSDPWKLPGTLTVPSGAGPFPAVVLVHGSGPNDRDETLGLNKPFKDLAWGLSSNGTVVLRYDKRTKRYAVVMAKLTDSITVKEEVLDDAAAAVVFLRARPEVDPERVFVLGHSLGAMLAPRFAQEEPGIAGLMLLAVPTRPFEDLVLAQVQYLAALDGSVSAEEQAQIDSLKPQIALVKDPAVSGDVAATQLPLGIAAPYWLDLRGYHPEQVAASLTVPLLVLQGARDYQVTTDDFEAWKTALDSRDDARLVLYPDLNHLFMTGQGMSTPTEYEQPGHVDAQVIRDISSWIDASSSR
ncbi:MAG: alpha/beta hydrolase [Thermoleophilia bacterium]